MYTHIWWGYRRPYIYRDDGVVIRARIRSDARRLPGRGPVRERNRLARDEVVIRLPTVACLKYRPRPENSDAKSVSETLREC